MRGRKNDGEQISTISQAKFDTAFYFNVQLVNGPLPNGPASKVRKHPLLQRSPLYPWSTGPGSDGSAEGQLPRLEEFGVLYLP
jgi:hypothetical protein